MLGKEVASQPTEAGSTFRVYRAHLAAADAQLKVGGQGGRGSAPRPGCRFCSCLLLVQSFLQAATAFQVQACRSAPLCSCTALTPARAPPLPRAKALHKRMEPLLLFFVDAAAAIDPEDDGWHLFTIVEEPPKVAGAPGPAVVGFATAYR